MNIDYLYLILAVALLWLPRQWLRIGRSAARKLGLARRRRNREFVRIRESGDNRVNFTEEFKKPRNYIDFMRALLGGLILIGKPEWGLESCFQHTSGISSSDAWQFVFQVQMGLITVGVLRQFVRWEGRVTFYAPLFYFAGLAVAMCGAGPGFLAFLLVWTINTALPVPPVGFLTVYALALWMLGLVFRGITDFYIYAATVLFLLPVVVSLMAKRSLALFNKRFK